MNQSPEAKMDLAEITSFLQLVSSFLVAITGIVSIIIGIIRPLRKWLMRQLGNREQVAKIESKVENLEHLMADDKKEQELMKEAFICLTRNALTEIWHKAEVDKYISDWDRDNFDAMAQAYFALGGNHYIQEVYRKIMDLPSTPPRKRTAKKAAPKKR